MPPPARDLRQPIISFTRACWERLLGAIAEEPSAADYGIPESLAEVIRRQCVIERNRELYLKALKLAAAQKPGVKGPP